MNHGQTTVSCDFLQVLVAGIQIREDITPSCSFKSFTLIYFNSMLPKVAAWQAVKTSINLLPVSPCGFGLRMLDCTVKHKSAQKKDKKSVIASLLTVNLVVHCVSGWDCDCAHRPTRPVPANAAASWWELRTRPNLTAPGGHGRSHRCTDLAGGTL